MRRNSSHRKTAHSNESGHDADGQLGTPARTRSAQGDRNHSETPQPQKSADSGRKPRAIIGADDEPDEMCGTMMPTNATGPPEATRRPPRQRCAPERNARPVATSTPRGGKAEAAPRVNRETSTRGSVANPTQAMVIGTSAAPIGAYAAMSSDPISQRTVWNVSVKSARFGSEPANGGNESRQRHPRQQEHHRRRAAPPRRGEPYHNRQGAERAQKAGQRNGGDPEHREIDVKRDGQHRAERRAGRDAQRVGRRQRVAEQRLKDDAGQGEAAPDQRRREHARQARHEEDLRVDVVGEGIERSNTFSG